MDGGLLNSHLDSGAGIDAGQDVDAGMADAGSGDGGTELDTPPTHPLNITATRALHSHTFLPHDADPSVRANTFSGTGTEVAAVDPRAAKMLGKLVVTLQGSGSTAGSLGSSGAFCVARGFHVFGVAYDANYNVVLNDANYYGDARKEEFDGIDHTSPYALRDNMPAEKLGLDAADGVLQRVTRGLHYLQQNFPAEDWGYFLAADGTVRWSDVIFAGVSHGASSAARYAELVRAGGAVSFAGPRDNTCADAACSGAIIATWFTEIPKTPIERFYGVTGAMDPQHPQHLAAFERLGYLGRVTEVDTGQPPYGGTHRLTSASSGHTGFCDAAQFKNLCNYVFQVPPENQAGVP